MLKINITGTIQEILTPVKTLKKLIKIKKTEKGIQILLLGLVNIYFHLNSLLNVEIVLKRMNMTY